MVLEGKGKSLLTFPNDFCIVDIETTGLDYLHCNIIEISALKIREHQIVDSYSTLVQPDAYYMDSSAPLFIDSYISDLTGITNDMLLSSPKLSSVLPSFDNFVKDELLIGHNIVSFDSNFLYYAYKNNLNKLFPTI